MEPFELVDSRLSRVDAEAADGDEDWNEYVEGDSEGVDDEEGIETVNDAISCNYEKFGGEDMEKKKIYDRFITTS